MWVDINDIFFFYWTIIEDEYYSDLSQGFPSKNVPAIVTEVCDDVHDNGNVINMEPNNNRMSSSNSNLSNIDAASVDQTHLGWTTMTPQQIAIWIDKRARFVFPVGFLVFNIFYWIFVLVV